MSNIPPVDALRDAAKAVKKKVDSATKGDFESSKDLNDNQSIGEEAVKRWAFHTVASNTADIFKETMKEERSKKIWRNIFICLFLTLLIASLTLFVVGIYLDATKDYFDLSTEVIVGAFVYFLTNIFAIIHLLSKYVSNSQYLKIFETLSTGLISYLTKNIYEVTKNDDSKVKKE